MFKKTGVPTKEMIRSRFPKDKKVLFRPKAIIECYDEIPCNPCETVCPFSAITIGEDINAIPQIDFDKCTGCGICVHSCPGLAIIVAMIKNGKAYFKVPYELLPLPKVKERWLAVNRNGDVISKCKIENVMTAKKSTNNTTIVTVSLEQPYLYDFITIRRPHE
ncbi:MAG: 4Fe-4S binding protein [Tenericutes bacterium]|jgi:Fe-S-cluster-containing hydrogenase component 2|nr:4Fe-4S binding protein [Mycoplasmatota bacterium]